MGGIFISYRRSDVSGYAHALQARLENRFGPDRVFMDIDSIELGEDFVEIIQKALDSSSVVLVLIGKRWFQPERLQDPNDFVRLEISLALQKRKRVIPVLLEGATPPKPEDLPEPLRPLTRRQACELSDTRFDSDVARLIEAIGKDSVGVSKEPVFPTPPSLPEATTLLKKRLGVIVSFFLRASLLFFNSFLLWAFWPESYVSLTLLPGALIFLFGGSFIRQLRYKKNPYVLLSLTAPLQFATMAIIVSDSGLDAEALLYLTVPTLLTGWLAWYHLTER